MSCDGTAVPGKYKVRVDDQKLQFTFYPDRESNPLKPGQCECSAASLQPVLALGPAQVSR